MVLIPAVVERYVGLLLSLASAGISWLLITIIVQCRGNDIPYLLGKSLPEQQSSYLQYAKQMDLGIPVILVGGNLDVEILETIIQNSLVDFIALSPPLFSEPDLPDRWRRSLLHRCLASMLHDIVGLDVHSRR
jgi:2,4-dienoyl-CoA reductase-like NADH-dependent reductase (Old Yellow Enzyme family)